VSKKVPVFDSFGNDVLFHVTRTKAQRMLDSGVACELIAEPREIRLKSSPASRAMEMLLHPDRSLTVGPSVIHGAAVGVQDCRNIFEDSKGWRSERFDNRGGMVKTGEKIRRARVDAGISQAVLGSLLGRSQIWQSRLERGVETVPPEFIAKVFVAIERVKKLREAAKHQPPAPIFDDLKLPTHLETANRF
jgi:hypothetical protein